ncbi:MAG: TIGR03560 family F420-dependent LLM class oxidoreductase [Candidatus Tectomicrobia bacterium]|nr:TIGR03560 family F420-dependent LLM class oxidoreductase [Candidatus Tectomicrobia bacterium]
MRIKLGVHTGPQDLQMDELKRVWARADEAGFHWISVWDHFYANPLNQRTDPCFEAVASMAAVAALTSNVRIGCLVFCTLFRNPGLLAKAAVTIDHISNGRCELGLGGGWFEEEFREFGYGFPPIKERLDQMEEAVQVIKSLLEDPVTNFKGKYYDMQGAVCGPKPIQDKLPIWIGGQGPRRTPRMAAQYADGYNLPYVTPEVFKQRMEQIDAACDKFGRDPASITRSVNLHFNMGADEAGAAAGRQRLERFDESLRLGALTGTPSEVIDRIGAYIESGADGLNIAFRPPVDWEAYEAYIEEVLPVFHTS